MPAYDLVVFDLDGTLSDPLTGIERSLNYALTHFGYEPRESTEVARYVGPPLDQTFSAITGITSQSEIEALVAKYRERYSEIGFAENILYPGIPEALSKLSEAGIAMGVCTSKRTDFAKRILEMFGLCDHFLFVDGADIGVQKKQQLANLCAKGIATPDSLMVGDRAVDLAAAHHNGMHAAGVLWGYGSAPELEREQPHRIFHLPEELSVLAPAAKPAGSD